MDSVLSQKQADEIKPVQQTSCCIVGGGPAGAILALLLARQGVDVMLLEAHTDFDRDFRGDTVHPSILRVLDEIGLMDRLLAQVRHTKMEQVRIQTPGGEVTVADFGAAGGRYNYVAVMPQARFLEFIVGEASQYDNFHRIMGALVSDLVEDGTGKVTGVRYRGNDGWYEVQASLVVGADGRFSKLRKLAGFEPVRASQPMDVLWFRVSHQAGDLDFSVGRAVNRQIVVVIDRGDYWQMGYVIPKGSYQTVRAAGLDELRRRVSAAVPEMADRLQELQSWKQVSVLSVEANILERWYRPGLLLIGDAAHTMSPIGGVGISYAVQDAVIAANLLGPKLRYGIVQMYDLALVQRYRMLPTRAVQLFQVFLQQRILSVAHAESSFKFPLLMRIGLRLPGIRRIPAYLIGYGIFPVHVKR